MKALLINLGKVAAWHILLLAMLKIWGPWAAVPFAVFVFLWNIVVTVRGKRKQGIGAADTLKQIFSRGFFFPFLVYGCYCSPGYGLEEDLKPIDGLDWACRWHDLTMFYADERYKEGTISRRDRTRVKNEGDWNFMGKVWMSRNNANGIYLLWMHLGFMLRIIGRTIFIR